MKIIEVTKESAYVYPNGKGLPKEASTLSQVLEALQSWYQEKIGKATDPEAIKKAGIRDAYAWDDENGPIWLSGKIPGFQWKRAIAEIQNWILEVNRDHFESIKGEVEKAFVDRDCKLLNVSHHHPSIVWSWDSSKKELVFGGNKESDCSLGMLKLNMERVFCAGESKFLINSQTSLQGDPLTIKTDGKPVLLGISVIVTLQRPEEPLSFEINMVELVKILTAVYPRWRVKPKTLGEFFTRKSTKNEVFDAGSYNGQNVMIQLAGVKPVLDDSLVDHGRQTNERYYSKGILHGYDFDDRDEDRHQDLHPQIVIAISHAAGPVSDRADIVRLSDWAETLANAFREKIGK